MRVGQRLYVLKLAALGEMSAKVAFLSQPMTQAQRAPRPAVNADAIVLRAGRDVVMGARAKFARWLKLVAPGVVDRMALKALNRDTSE